MLSFATVQLAALLVVPPTTRPGELETVLELNLPPGNVTLTPDGDLVLSIHQFFDLPQRVIVRRRDGRLNVFPNEAWALGGATDRVALDSVLGLRSDAEGWVWLLDNGLRGGTVPKLVAWDTRRDRLARVIHIPPPVSIRGSFLNDLQVDPGGGAIYIADPAGGQDAALVVVDLATGLARRVLSGHVSVVPEDVEMVIDDRPVELRRPDGSTVRPRVGVNPIALDHEGRWLYFGPMSGTRLYRVRTADLRNEGLTPPELAARVEPYAERPICDGISMDSEGNIYVSEVCASAVGVIDAQRRYRRLYEDPERLSWPDAFSFGPDGYLYVVSNQLQRSAALNAGRDESRPPYYVLRFKPLAGGVVGR